MVAIGNSEKMVNALKRYNSAVKFTVYPEAKHDSWTVTYDNPEFYSGCWPNVNIAIRPYPWTLKHYPVTMAATPTIKRHRTGSGRGRQPDHQSARS
ncbi:hypothetical protein [Chitinophaga sedimenti]|uniref:hypothetical protein n=1 Tax=Chitinophaga sedimenti TaxID=2033606 RepID=UPI0035576FB4